MNYGLCRRPHDLFQQPPKLTLFFVLLASLPFDSEHSDTDLGSVDDLDQASPDEPVELESEPIPDGHPAYDRVQTPLEADVAPRVLNRRTVIGVLIVVAALLVTYLIVRASGGNGGDSPDLLTLAASNAPTVRLEVLTDDLDEAEEYILGEFGWPIRVPILAGSRLVGVGVDEIVEGVELPVLQYATSESEPITVYVFDYAFLDAAAGRISLTPAVYARLAEDDGVDVRRVEGSYIILWRRRAVIYTAVMLEDPSPIAEGLRRGR